MSQTAKDRGNTAYGAGRYSEAVELFTQAIEAGGVEQHVLYSNRSASYCQLKQFTKAVEDADRSIELKPSWAKGYSRKGTALYESGRYAEAYNAFQRGVQADPSSESLKLGLDNALRKLQSTGASAPSSAPVGTVRQILTRDYKETAMFLLHGFVLTQFVLFLIPIGGVSRGAARRLVLATAIRCLIYLYKQHGRPQFNMQYGQQIMMDPSAPILFLSILLFASRPYVLPMLPLVLVQLFHFGVFFYSLAQATNEGYSRTLASAADGILVKVMNDPAWPRKQQRQKTEEVWRKITEISALCEVFHGIYLLIEVLLPTRNLMGLMLFWQYLQMRYMVEQARNDSMAIRNAFRLVDNQILTLANHQYAPAFVRTGYNYVRTFLRNKAQPPQPGQQSSCTVM